uniref:alanine transaminase n=1 Tax=Cyprinus carpio TaxID=7962 RepID=A0A8C2HS54_CYPCA
MKGSFKKVLDLSSGDSHNAGIKPITFVRQVAAGCAYPRILQGDALPPDARLRVQKLLSHFDGGSIGSYTESCGSMHLRNTVAKFISLRDGGVLSSPEQVFITVDTQRALMVMLRLLCQSEGVSAVMIPDPAPHTLTRLLEGMDVVPVTYQLQEQSGWSVERAELNRAIQAPRGRCFPKAIYISNPGNPTGHVQSRESIQDVIRFAADEELFLLVDEESVSQDTVFADGSEFVSYKRILAEMGQPYSDRVQLASLHSLSNGIMGECGFRTGFMELVNVDEAVMFFTEVLLTGDLCPPVIGQIALDVMVDPPRPGEPSYSLYTQVHAKTIDFLSHNLCFFCLTILSYISQLRFFLVNLGLYLTVMTFFFFFFFFVNLNSHHNSDVFLAHLGLYLTIFTFFSQF